MMILESMEKQMGVSGPSENLVPKHTGFQQVINNILNVDLG